MERPALALGLALLLSLPLAGPPPSGPDRALEATAGGREAAAGLSALPPQGFIENAGQLSDGSIRFHTTGPIPAAFTDTGVTFLVRGPAGPAACAMRFAGARPVRPAGLDLLPAPCNFMFGNDHARWRTGVPAFGGLLYEGLYTGIDLRFLAREGGLKYEFSVAPGADPAAIALEYEGAVPSPEGRAVRLDTPAGPLRDGEPVAYQPSEGGPTAVEVLPVVSGSRVSFWLGGYDRSRPLVIDPLLCCTVVGGSADDYAMAMAVDRFDNAYITGETLSADFPVTPNNWSGRPLGDPSSFDLLVVKLAPDGRRVLFSTYIGSGANDFAHDIRVDGSGFVYVTGYTYGFDFPVTNGSFDRSYNGYGDVFVLKLSPAGTTLLFSTYVGGDDVDFGYALAVAGDLSVIVAGGTRSMDLPVTPGAFQTSIRTGPSDEDAFVLRLSSDGSTLQYCTYLGGGGRDYVLAVEADAAGRATVAGTTTSPDLPVTAGALSSSLGDTDAFVARLGDRGDDLEFCTYLGGSGVDTAASLVLEDSGGCLVAGETTSSDFPGAFSGAGGPLKGRRDCYVARVAGDGTRVDGSTFFGGSGDESAAGLVRDSGGNITLAGSTSSGNLPVTAAASGNGSGGLTDLFIARFDSSFRDLLYASYLGGAGNDTCAGVAFGASGELVLAGTTDSPDLPGTTNGTDGSRDVFLARLAPVCVPGEPTLTVKAGDHAVLLRWTPSRVGSGGLTGYAVYRGKAPGALALSCGLQAGQLEYLDSGLENGVMYHYALSARNASGESALSAVRAAMPGLPPSAPRNLTAAAAPSLVSLSWEQPEALHDLPVLKYRLSRWRSGTASALHAEVVNATSFEDRSASNDILYCYVVTAVNIIGEGDHSNEVQAMPSGRPSAPENLSVRADGRSATLIWDRPSNLGAGEVTGYTVFLQLDDGRRRMLGTTRVCLFVDRNLSVGNHSYRVRADSVLGEGYLSDTVTVEILNLPPVAGFTVDRLEGTTATPFAFSSAPSYDRDLEIVNYTWRFGDGTTAYEQDPIHYYPRRGLYNITLRVRDRDGGEATAEGMVLVLNTPPSVVSALPGPSLVVRRGGFREFALTVVDPDLDVVVTTWYLDGALRGTGNATRLTFDRTGEHSVVAEVSDGESTTRVGWNVTVEPEPPAGGRLPESWVAGAVAAAAAAVAGAAVFRLRAARRSGGPGGPAGRKGTGRAGPGRSRRRPVRRAPQKHIIRKRYS
ncbi:MAG: PKD domain-containing protein [Euryarchaeota archaeon]|nr:PKD domain-containing protein [Euryarchaeota archaeon]